MRHPACFAALMPDGWNFSVHHGDGILINHLCGERDKGSGRAPLVNPRGPARKSVLRTALTSRAPDCGRLDSPSWLGSPLSAIHGVQTLSFPLRFADFSGDTTPSLSYCRSKPHRCCCRLVFVGRIRRSRHPAMVPRRKCLMALRLSGLRCFRGSSCCIILFMLFSRQ
jgi:hypothetical protein